MKYWLAEEKYDDLLRKKAIIGRKKWKNGGKGEIFSVPGGKNIILVNGGGGKNILFRGNIHPCNIDHR